MTKRRIATLAMAIAAVGAVVASSACARRQDPAANQPATTAGTAPAGTIVTADGTVPANGDLGGIVPFGAPTRPAVVPVGGSQEKSLKTGDGQDRTYHIYVPSSLERGAKVPLLLALHGGLGSGVQFEGNSGFDGLAEANRFIVVYPDGIKLPALPNSRVWNGGGCCGPAAQDKQNVDDVGFIAAVIDEVATQQPVDRTKVFATGHSNGAIMSYRLACELSDKIAAIAVQAGTLFIDSCRPTKPVPVLQVHGTADQNLPLNGGKGDKGLSGEDFPPPIDGMKQLAEANGCAATTTDFGSTTNPDVSYQIWSQCPHGDVVELVKVQGANHAWMGHPPASRAGAIIVGEPYANFDSSAAVWSFLAAHPRS